MSVILDENGKVTPESPLFAQLDEWHDKDQYESIVNAILNVPRKNWSNKLWFRLISAYNNLEQYEKAIEELNKIEPLCDNPVDLSRFHYMHGYIHYRRDREYLAIAAYKRGIEADPGNTIGLNLENEIENCREYIEKNLSKLRALSERIAADIKKSCSRKSDKMKLSEEELTLYLGFLPAVRLIQGHEHSIGFGGYFTKYKGAEKQATLDWLKGGFNITDRESLLDFYQNAPQCNIYAMSQEVRLFLAGTPRYDMDQLNKEERYLFDCCAEFIGTFNEFLPKAGVLAWDIGEKVGFLRWAYACDLITNTDYAGAMLFLHDYSKKMFSSFEEYITSLAFGAAVFMFNMNGKNISGSVDFLARTASLLINGDLPNLEW